MKIAVIIVRVLMGLMFLFASIVYFFNLMPQPEQKGNVKIFMDGIAATHYLLTLIMATELVCGIAFVAGRFVPLATVVIFPITLNILLFHAFVAPEGLPVAVLCPEIYPGICLPEKLRDIVGCKTDVLSPPPRSSYH